MFELRTSSNVNIAVEGQPYTIEMQTLDLGDERGSNVYRSTDQGKSFERIGQQARKHMNIQQGWSFYAQRLCRSLSHTISGIP